MTVKLSTATRNGLLGTRGLTTQFLRGAIRVYSGPQPLSADDAPTGTLLGVITENGAAWAAGAPAGGLQFDPPVDGVLQKTSDAWRMTGLAAGTAGWWRLVGNAADDDSKSTTLVRIDGAVGVGAGELRLSTTAITVGVPVTADRFICRMPG